MKQGRENKIRSGACKKFFLKSQKFPSKEFLSSYMFSDRTLVLDSHNGERERERERKALP